MDTRAERILEFNTHLDFSGNLPDGIKILNPFQNNPEIDQITESFYRKYYSDTRPRTLLLGINPGRLGAGSTGIPFTDTKRLAEDCGLPGPDFHTHEPSSVFVYQVIQAYGGPQAFYEEFYINSVCPLGFVRKNKKGNWVNYNYYDDSGLFKAVRPFILKNLKRQKELAGSGETCFALGKKNARFLEELNEEAQLFDRIVALEHPRYVVQYKSRQAESYVAKYLENLQSSKD